MKEQRGYGFIFTGLVIGLLLGLIYAWVIDPVSYVNSSPSTLREDFRDHYRLLIARSFAFNQDLGRASARLSLLGDSDSVQALVGQAQLLLSEEDKRSDAEALAALAERLAAGKGTPLAVTDIVSQPTEFSSVSTTTKEPDSGVKTATPKPESVSKTVQPTFTPKSMLTFTPTVNLPFVLAENNIVCNPNLPQKLLQVEVLDENENPLAGIKITVSWEGGADTFYTGLHPEMGPGYADFTMTEGITYTVRAGDASKPVSDLRVSTCSKNDSSTYPGGIKLIFK